MLEYESCGVRWFHSWWQVGVGPFMVLVGQVELDRPYWPGVYPGLYLGVMGVTGSLELRLLVGRWVLK